MRAFVCGTALLTLAFLLGPEILLAQAAQPGARSQSYVYRGKIISGSELENNPEQVQVYEKPNFDSVVVGMVRVGETYDISKNTFNNAFYKIRLKPGVLGYIADTDIQPLFKVASGSANRPEKNGKKTKKKSASKRSKTFEFTRFGGLTYALVDFTEDTLGGKPHENLGFLGAKISGPNVLLEGLLPMELNLLFYSGAPSYYAKATGRAASGLIFLGNILFQSYWPQTPRVMTYFGFGPMFKYSKFDVEMKDSATTKYQSYSLEDMTLGAAFELGIAFRLGSAALRFDYQYFWEKQMYGGFTGALQWAF